MGHYTCPKMEKAIKQIALQHGFDLTRADGAELIITCKGYMPLHIIAYGENTVRVAHIYYQNGDAMYDPDICFYTSGDKALGLNWIPISYEQSSLGLYQQVGFLKHGKLDKIAPRTMASIASFAEQWADNLTSQGFAALNAEVRIAA